MYYSVSFDISVEGLQAFLTKLLFVGETHEARLR